MTKSNDLEIDQLLVALKRIYKNSRLRYSDVAAMLQVKELTVKRWMGGRGLTVSALARLCGVANMTFSELALAAETRRELPVITNEQAREIADDIVLAMVFFLLTRGWSSERITKELRLDQVKLTRKLVKLDRLGAITLFPGNRVKVLRRLSGNIRHDRAIFGHVTRRVHQFFDNPDLNDPKMVWTNGIARLSRVSFLRMAEKLDQFRDEIFELGNQDLDLPEEEVAWYTMFVAAREVSIDTLLYETPADKETKSAG
jgi:transcriptional regulator with XRE-family HTH domain